MDKTHDALEADFGSNADDYDAFFNRSSQLSYNGFPEHSGDIGDKAGQSIRKSDAFSENRAAGYRSVF